MRPLLTEWARIGAAVLAAAALGACAQDPDALKVSIASPDGAQEIGVGNAVEFEAKVNGGEAPVKVVWDFDSTGVGGADPETSTEKNPGSVTFSSVGEYVITLEATDDAQQEASDSETVTASYETFVTGFVATSGNEQVTLTWTAPSHPDYQNFLIRRDEGTAPAETDDGDNVEPTFPVVSPLVDAVVENDTEYFYTIFAYTEADEYGEGVNANATPADKTAPGNPTSFQVDSFTDVEVVLSWALPSGGEDDDDVAGVIIKRGLGGPPFFPGDGVDVCDIAFDDPQTCTDDTDVEPSTTYGYAAFAYDDATEVNYSARATVTVTTADP